jgi:uncharacterized protein YdhG (YjbR/CyaY superfamily)
VETVEEYLGAAPEPQRTTLLALRATLRELLPDADETLSYGMPAFLVGGKPVAGYAWAKHHCSYYPPLRRRAERPRRRARRLRLEQGHAAVPHSSSACPAS